MALTRTPSGLPFTLANLAVRGIVCAVPQDEVRNDSLHETFGAEVVADVCRMIGVEARRRAPPEQTTSDLCQAAAETLLADLGWGRDSIDALIFISQTPDYTLPATACALHGRLQLHSSCAAFDVNLGCSGYAYGLWLAGKILDGDAIQRVLLLVGDTISKTTNPSDRATALLFGDAGSATALEFDSLATPAHFILGTDGQGAHHLMMPASAYRPYDGDDVRLTNRDPSRLFMDGNEIFNFTLTRVPQLVSDLLTVAGKSREQVDAFLFHQANTFMIKHIAKKAKISLDKVPLNMARFGNTSSASIPLLIADQLPQSTKVPMTVAMFGFGVGYSWAAALLDLPALAVNRLIEV